MSAGGIQLMRTDRGLVLSWGEYGAPGGSPVFYCHGWPSSRLEAAFLDDAAAVAGIRIIAADRPGYAESSFVPDRRIIDWPIDVARLADHLQLTTFHVIGVSGGAPYALACAQALAARVRSVAIVGGLGPLVGDAATAMSASRRALLETGVRRPQLLAVALLALRLWLSLSPRSFIGHFARHYPPRDQALAAIDANQWHWRAMVLEAFRHGTRGPVHDAALLARDWGFEPAAITCPIDLWHGERDSIVPAAVGRHLASRLAHCRQHFLADEGHFSTIVHHAGEIVRSLANTQNY